MHEFFKNPQSPCYKFITVKFEKSADFIFCRSVGYSKQRMRAEVARLDWKEKRVGDHPGHASVSTGVGL